MFNRILNFIGILTLIYIVYLIIKNRSFVYSSTKNKNLETLKNGLLSYALLKTADKNDLRNFNMNYKSFDGTKLPMFSGCSTANACLSYIQDKDEFRKCIFYTPKMEEKLVAIDKYLEKNFDSKKKVVEFFDKFICTMDPTEHVVDKDVKDDLPKIEEKVDAESNIDIEIINEDDIETTINESEEPKISIKKRRA